MFENNNIANSQAVAFQLYCKLADGKELEAKDYDQRINNHLCLFEKCLKATSGHKFTELKIKAVA